MRRARMNSEKRSPRAEDRPPQAPPARGLASHIRTWMLLGGMLPLVALFLYGYLAARGALIEASDEHLRSLVETRRTQIEAWLKERTTDLEVISRSKDCIEMVRMAAAHENHAAVCRYLESFQTGSRDYIGLALYDLAWQPIATNSGSVSYGTVVAGDSLRRRIESSPGPVIGAVETNTGSPAVHLANHLVPLGESPVGYVVASLDLSGTFAPILLDRAGLGRTGSVVLADHAGRVLLPESTSAVRMIPEPLLEEIGRSVAGDVHYRSTAGNDVFAAFTTIPERGWVVVARMDEAEALGLLRSLERGFVIVGALTILGVVLLSSRVSRRISAPLGALAQAARRVKTSDGHDRVPELGGREVEDVGVAFNEMLDALEESRRLQVQASTLAAVGEISSGIVHEMRNKLSAVKMNLQALERRVQSDAAHAELGRIALDQVARVERLMNELLGYARPVELQIAPTSVRKLLADTAAVLSGLAEEKGVRLAIDGDPAGDVVVVDRERLEEALVNLGRNAVEATASGGTVTLRAHRADDVAWTVEVLDEGAGLPEGSGDSLFRPFFTTKDGGTGLGLAMARKIAELHGGTITASNRPQGGAEFAIRLPHRPADEAVTEGAAMWDASAGSSRNGRPVAATDTTGGRPGAANDTASGGRPAAAARPGSKGIG